MYIRMFPVEKTHYAPHCAGNNLIVAINAQISATKVYAQKMIQQKDVEKSAVKLEQGVNINAFKLAIHKILAPMMFAKQKLK